MQAQTNGWQAKLALPGPVTLTAAGVRDPKEDEI